MVLTLQHMGQFHGTYDHYKMIGNLGSHMHVDGFVDLENTSGISMYGVVGEFIVEESRMLTNLTGAQLDMCHDLGKWLDSPSAYIKLTSISIIDVAMRVDELAKCDTVRRNDKGNLTLDGWEPVPARTLSELMRDIKCL